MRFQFALSGVVQYPPGSTLGTRQLSDHELVWILDGEVVWTSQGVARSAPPGTVILARPDTVENYCWDPRATTRHAFVHFSILDHGGVLPSMQRWPYAAPMPEGDVVRPLFRQVLGLLASRPQDWRPLADSALGHLLLAYTAGQVGALWHAPQDWPGPLRGALALVERRWASGRCLRIPLGDLARAAGVSPAYLCRIFRRRFGCAPLATLRLLRLERAAGLLSRSGLSVAEVATATGFDDPFHFSRSFRGRYGLSPMLHRRQLTSPRPDAALPAGLAELSRRLWG